MKAVVFHKMGDVRVDNVDDPGIEQPDDVILKVTSTAICGSDLHIYDGFIPQVKDQVLGHEFMGIVEEAGPEVNTLKPGDRVVVPFTSACGALRLTLEEERQADTKLNFLGKHIVNRKAEEPVY